MDHATALKALAAAVVVVLGIAGWFGSEMLTEIRAQEIRISATAERIARIEVVFIQRDERIDRIEAFQTSFIAYLSNRAGLNQETIRPQTP